MIILFYLVIGVIAAIVSDAFIEWDIDSNSPYVTNPGPMVRLVIVLFWPLFVALGILWLADCGLRRAATALRKAIRS